MPTDRRPLLVRVESFLASLRSTPQRDLLLRDVRQTLSDEAPDGKMADALRLAKQVKGSQGR